MCNEILDEDVELLKKIAEQKFNHPCQYEQAWSEALDLFIRQNRHFIDYL